MKNLRPFLSIIILIAVAIALGVAWKYAPMQKSENTDENTSENFESARDTIAFNEKILMEGIYITPLLVLSDSRCPIDVNCIWAGEVSVKVKLEKGMETREGVTSEEVILKESGSVMFEGKTVSLIAVLPAKKSTMPIQEKDYRFLFDVME